MTSDADHPGEMTDEELDQILAAGNGELLDHIQAVTDPGSLLSELIDHGTPAQTIPVKHESASGAWTRAIIQLRLRLDRLAGKLSLALDLAFDLDLATSLDFATGLASALDLATGLARGLASARDFASDLDLYVARASGLASALDLVTGLASALGLARGLASANDLDVDVARELLRTLKRVGRAALVIAEVLSAEKVDASDADLSDLQIRGIKVLDGVIWTDRTAWPAALRDQVRTHSVEITSGVYKVRLGQRDDAKVL